MEEVGDMLSGKFMGTGEDKNSWEDKMGTLGGQMPEE